MRRTVVCLLIAIASTSVAAREAKLSAADGGSCPNQDTRLTTGRSADHDAATPAPARETKATTPGGDEEAGPRLQSPRWHRFLPGMFR